MANINARSPYLVRVTDSAAESAQLEIWIYSGIQLTEHTSTPTYTLTSTMINEEAVFDIAPLVKDYFEYTHDGSGSKNFLWVDYRVTKNLSEKTLYYYSSEFYTTANFTTSIGTLYFAHNAPDYDFNITGTSPDNSEVFNVIYTDASLQTPYTATSDIYNARTDELYGYYALYGAAGLVTGYAQGLQTISKNSDSTYVASKLVTETTQEAVVQNLAFNGYGYFEDGTNPQNVSNGVFGFFTDLFIPEDESFYIPVYNYVSGTTITLYDENNNSISSYTTVESTESSNVAYYLSANSSVKKFSTDRKEFNVTRICEPKYTPIKLTYINKGGFLNELWFFKNSKLSIETKEEGYRANIVNSGSYSINNHQYKTLYKEAKESLTINSGFYPESNNEAFKQLLLSEQVWIDYKGQTLPVKIKDSSISFQDRLTEKNINYTMNIEFAFDKINNVR